MKSVFFGCLVLAVVGCATSDKGAPPAETAVASAEAEVVASESAAPVASAVPSASAAPVASAVGSASAAVPSAAPGAK